MDIDPLTKLGLGRSRTRILSIASAAATAGAVLVLASGTSTASASQDDNVTLCHATSSTTNPWEVKTVDAAGAYDGHMGHNEPNLDVIKHEAWGDIIPPFVYDGNTYSLNWTAQGQAIWNNGCTVVDTTPSPSESSSAPSDPPSSSSSAPSDPPSSSSSAPSDPPSSSSGEPPPSSSTAPSEPPSCDATATSVVRAGSARRLAADPCNTESVPVTPPPSTSSSGVAGVSASASDSTSAAPGDRSTHNADGAGVAGLATSTGPIPGAVDAGLHAPISGGWQKPWGIVLLLLGGALGLGAGAWPTRRRAH